MAGFQITKNRNCHSTSPWLFISGKSYPHFISLSRYRRIFHIKPNASVNKELIRIGKLAGITKHFSFHTARHTNATLLIYKGVQLSTVQKLLGHRNIKTTQVYGEVLPQTIIKELKNASFD